MLCAPEQETNMTDSHRPRAARHERGFSLVELLVVISIMGILAGVVVFAVGGVTDRGQTSACQTDTQTIRTAIEAYRAQNGSTTRPTEAQLVSGGFLATQSTLHNVAWSGAGVLTIPFVAPCTT